MFTRVRVCVGLLAALTLALVALAVGTSGPAVVGLGAGIVASVAAAASLLSAQRTRSRLEASLAELESSRADIAELMKRAGDAFGALHDMNSLLRVVLDTATRAMKARSGVVYLLSRNELSIRIAHNMDQAVAGKRIRVGEGIAGRVAQTREPLLTPGHDAPPPSDLEPRASSVIAVPLKSASQMIGVLVLYGREIDRPFDENDLEMVSSLARQAAVGIENVLLHEEAKRLSITDGLTGLWNRRYLTMRLAQEVERSIRFRRPLSALMLDVDYFKSINDRFGHQRGDAVLIELARRITSAVRGQVDTLARHGGEEFVLVLPETASEGARTVGQKIMDAVSREPFGTDGEEPIWVTVSIGIATFPQHGYTPQTLLSAADNAMYDAKSQGRNCIVIVGDQKLPPGVQTLPLSQGEDADRDGEAGETPENASGR